MDKSSMTCQGQGPIPPIEYMLQSLRDIYSIAFRTTPETLASSMSEIRLKCGNTTEYVKAWPEYVKAWQAWNEAKARIEAITHGKEPIPWP